MFGRRRRIQEIISRNYGRNPVGSSAYYDASNRMEDIRRYHDSIKQAVGPGCLLDDITWEDLEMDQVFVRVNHTDSFIGEQMLFHKLHRVRTDDDPDFECRLEFLDKNEKERVDIETRLFEIGKDTSAYYLSEFLQNTDLWKIGNSFVLHILQILLAFFFLAAILFENAWCVAGLVCVAMLNLMIYLGLKVKYEIYLDALGEFIRIYDFADWMVRYDKESRFSPEHVRNAVKSLKNLSKGVMRINGRKQSTMTGDAAAILADYIWGITLLDVSMFNHIMKTIYDKQDAVITLLEYVGEIDSEIAVLSYRKSLDFWCAPQYGERGIRLRGFVHPLLENPVKNDFVLNDRAIITGANASGKSTFMKAVAINCILAQTINTCTAERMRLGRMYVMTCMSLRDDIMSGESYYYREAKYLKRMLDMIDAGIPILCVIDEILKGTNTSERIAASKAILEYIGKTDSMVLVATHDSELTESKRYRKYHFENRIGNGDIQFDYKIYEGNSVQSNAIALLELLNYPKPIIDCARRNMR